MGDSRILTTLCYIEKDEKFLMMHRVSKKQDANAGKWIGVGGHFQEGESPDECLLREVQEETGLQLTSYSLRGIITFVSDEWGYEYMFLYTADGFEGSADEESLAACTEGHLQWIPKEQIMDLNLWEGDRVFLKLLLEKAGFFTLKLVYRGEELIEKKLRCEGYNDREII
ncbi:MAG: 8-oxo-dGTP diphosphatase [Lachnospiraceae bacterium]|nr:8-oxo-dGTP diphosphatase [Lachnospiraceae bacterium]